MDKCLNCDRPLEHIEGRRKKVFCGANCRVAFHRKKEKPESVTIPKAEYEELKILSARVVKDKEVVMGEFAVAVSKPQSGAAKKTKTPTDVKPFLDYTVVDTPKRNNITPQDWVNEKREIDNDADYQDWIKRLDASNLPKDIKKQIKFA